MKKWNFIAYTPTLKQASRELRKRSTLAEVLLWQQIKNRQVRSVKFLRQRPVDRYIIDFYCPALLLAIEVDGSTHDWDVEGDQSRQQRLESLGISFLRIQDRDIKRNLEGVLKLIEKWIDTARNSGPAANNSSFHKRRKPIGS